jgi:hypothetical protein
LLLQSQNFLKNPVTLTALTFWQLLCKAKEIYDYYEYIEGKLIDRISLVMESISKKELQSAITTLADSKVSNNKEREISSAITQLRLALEKTSQDIVAAKIAAIIALCYSILNEGRLARIYEDRSVRCFESHYDKKLAEMKVNAVLAMTSNHYIKYPSISSLAFIYNQLLVDAKDFGLNIEHGKVDILQQFSMMLGVAVVPIASPLIGEWTAIMVQDAKEQYAINLQTLLRV